MCTQTKDVIYNGQYDVLKNTESGPKIKEMWEQEKEHLAAFEQLLIYYRTNPTVMLPLWDILGNFYSCKNILRRGV